MICTGVFLLLLSTAASALDVPDVGDTVDSTTGTVSDTVVETTGSVSDTAGAATNTVGGTLGTVDETVGGTLGTVDETVGGTLGTVDETVGTGIPGALPLLVTSDPIIGLADDAALRSLTEAGSTSLMWAFLALLVLLPAMDNRQLRFVRAVQRPAPLLATDGRPG